MWYSILEFLNVAGVVTNSFLVAFTSSYGRTWEGDPSTTNTTQLVFNNATNTTEQVFVITQHLAKSSRLWLIIGFEVRTLDETDFLKDDFQSVLCTLETLACFKRRATAVPNSNEVVILI